MHASAQQIPVAALRQCCARLCDLLN
jgi:hypothetical protein